jgi:hypothetical protein
LRGNLEPPGPELSPEISSLMDAHSPLEADRARVKALLFERCGHRLWRISDLDIERLRRNILKRIKGRMDRLEKEVQRAEMYWRDCLSRGLRNGPTPQLTKREAVFGHLVAQTPPAQLPVLAKGEVAHYSFKLRLDRKIQTIGQQCLRIGSKLACPCVNQSGLLGGASHLRMDSTPSSGLALINNAAIRPGRNSVN